MKLTKKQIRERFVNICLKRDHYRCRVCRTQIGDITVHHITDRKEMPAGGYTKSNGVTLCPDCHLQAEKFHMTDGEEWIENMHPNDLYVLIGSNRETAYIDAIKLAAEQDEE